MPLQASSPRPTKRHILPDGRTVYVASGPRHAEELQRELSRDANEGVRVLVQSTPEHLEVLRTIQAHHRQRHEDIRKKYQLIFEQLDPITAELDNLAAELSQISTQNISLDANFDRFGYAAQIRIREAPENVEQSDFVSSGDSRSSTTSGGQRKKSIKFWKRPVVRQYFHDGLLWRASENEEVAAFELFFDLLYVGIVATIGDAAAENATGEGLLHFAIVFFLAYKIWQELVLTVQWFESDDILQRVLVLLSAVLLVGLATNISDAFDTTYTPLIAFFLASRVAQALYILFVATLAPMFRASLPVIAFGILIPAALWIVSIHVPNPTRLSLIWIAIVLEMADKSLPVMLNQLAPRLKIAKLSALSERFGAVPALNIEHRNERQNAFVTLIFGYMAVNLVYQHGGQSNGLDGFFAKAVLGLVTAYSFNSLYFEIDGRNLAVHSIRRSIPAYLCWHFLHIPFVMAFALASGTLAKLVIAHDCPNASIEHLTEEFVMNSDQEISSGQRWFYSAGLGVALACMGGIALTHKHRDSTQLRLAKRYRLAVRFVISAVMICLPIAGDRLNSLDLIGIDTGLLVLLLAIDYWGSTPSNEPFWWEDEGCSYKAECKLTKSEMKDLQDGVALDIVDIAKKNQKEIEGREGLV